MKALAENKHLLGLIRTINLYCRYKPRGCDEVMTYDQFEEHEKECGKCNLCGTFGIVKKVMNNHYLDECPKFQFRCHFCGTDGTRDEIINKHRCFQQHCGQKKGGSDFYFTKGRIANHGNMKNIIEQLQCAVCKNLMRQPK